MENVQDIIDFAAANPLIAWGVALALIVLLLWALWPRGGEPRGKLRERIDALQRNFIRLVQDRRLDRGSEMHDLMALPLRQWPHDPYAFYTGVLAAVEHMAEHSEPLTRWPEATADQNVQIVANDFQNLMRAIAGLADPSPIVPKGYAREAREARAKHLQRMRQSGPKP